MDNVGYYRIQMWNQIEKNNKNKFEDISTLLPHLNYIYILVDKDIR
jgi:hypothetical protein